MINWVGEAKEKFKKAAKAFTKINHVRGCYRTYQHLNQLKSMTEEARKSQSA